MMPARMDPMETVSGLAGIAGRGPGTDAERRAARWLQGRLRDAGRDAELEPHWVRPQWPLVHGLHAAGGVAGSVVAVYAPAVGLGILVAVLVSCVLDLIGRAHLLRRATPQRATQNVVSPPPPAGGGAERVVRLVVSARYDAPRSGLVYREAVRRLGARAQRAAGGRLPGALGWIALALIALAAIAAARLAGLEPGWLGVVQLVPSAFLLLVVAAMVDIGLSETVPGAVEPASAAGVALALAGELDRHPPRRLGVEVVLAGAGDGPSLGMRGFVRGRRRRYRPEATVVLHLEPCGRGRPHWWTVDGPLVPHRLHPRLRELCEAVADEERHLRACPHRGHGLTGALRARLARWPAVAVGCLDDDEIVPGARQPGDRPGGVDPRAMESALEFCLALVERLDEDLGRRAGAEG